MISIYDVLAFEEGFRERPYYCSEGYPTIGIGTKIGTKGADLNLFSLRVSKDVAGAMLQMELDNCIFELTKCDWYCGLDEARMIMIQSMAYQLGVNGLFKFKKMIAALEQGDYVKAEAEALDSKWARQTPDRAERHADVIRSGSIESVYGGIL